ncbi:TetR/AcrR family transcriptional regulator [Nocardia sp. alder85J]|uniref:TetR/AcrR family transcriptional regulator n=1 Tax=Nocardia sp. alder85J TaxID=2862949 RepID=UPI001CD2E145|nr:TetR/AcrR family transcriptional regulator [Nocardia sp. alder85J]MCX4096941.1 helix-turn-helix domain containing protein [Nocardia sp. alder85J]
MRADARRNYERIIECARQAFTEHGPDAPLDDIARRACVGAGTLYRHFPNRDALIEAVYRARIEHLAGLAYELAETMEPMAALEQWLRDQVAYVLSEHSLALTLKSSMDQTSETFTMCRTMMTDAAAALLTPAQQAGLVRADLEPHDLIRLGHGIATACETAPDVAPRLLSVAVNGLRPVQE